MKLGSCPCCGSRDLKKLQGEQFTCLACNAPLRFTWSAAHGVGIVLPITLPNLMQQFSDPIRYGIPAVLLVVLLILYFRFRRFHLDTISIAEKINTAQVGLYDLDRFITGKIGVIDLVGKIDSFKNIYGKTPEIQALIHEHFNRIGGLTTDEQERAFSALYPDADINSIAQQQAEEIKTSIASLKSYQLKV